MAIVGSATKQGFSIYRVKPKDTCHLLFHHKASPLTYVEQVQVPVMLVVGMYDHLCPLRSNAHYMAHLQAQGKPYECYLFAGGHSTTNPEEQIRQVEAQINFVAAHLGTPRAISIST